MVGAFSLLQQYAFPTWDYYLLLRHFPNVFQQQIWFLEMNSLGLRQTKWCSSWWKWEHSLWDLTRLVFHFFPMNAMTRSVVHHRTKVLHLMSQAHLVPSTARPQVNNEKTQKASAFMLCEASPTVFISLLTISYVYTMCDDRLHCVTLSFPLPLLLSPFLSTTCPSLWCVCVGGGICRESLLLHVHHSSDNVIWRWYSTVLLSFLWLLQSFHSFFHDGPWTLGRVM